MAKDIYKKKKTNTPNIHKTEVHPPPKQDQASSRMLKGSKEGAKGKIGILDPTSL